jgi:hypothetical protein
VHSRSQQKNLLHGRIKAMEGNGMLRTDSARRLLIAIATSLPETERSFVSGLDLRPGYDGSIDLSVRTPHLRSSKTSAHWDAIRTALGDELAGELHTTSITWGAF